MVNLDDDTERIENVTLDDEQIDYLRDTFFGLANDLKKDIPKAIEMAESRNTVEPIVGLFTDTLGLLASICAMATVLSTESRVKLCNCQGCTERKNCQNYLSFLDTKEAEKQGLLFESPIVYSDKKH